MLEYLEKDPEAVHDVIVIFPKDATVLDRTKTANIFLEELSNKKKERERGRESKTNTNDTNTQKVCLVVGVANFSANYAIFPGILLVSVVCVCDGDSQGTRFD